MAFLERCAVVIKTELSYCVKGVECSVSLFVLFCFFPVGEWHKSDILELQLFKFSAPNSDCLHLSFCNQHISIPLLVCMTLRFVNATAILQIVVYALTLYTVHAHLGLPLSLTDSNS